MKTIENYECSRCGGKRIPGLSLSALKLSALEREFIFNHGEEICQPCIIQLKNKYVIKTNRYNA